MCDKCKDSGICRDSEGRLQKCSCRIKEELKEYLSGMPAPPSVPTVYPIIPCKSCVVQLTTPVLYSLWVMLSSQYPKSYIYLTYDNLVMSWLKQSASSDTLRDLVIKNEIIFVDFGKEQYMMKQSSAVLSDIVSTIARSGKILFLLYRNAVQELWKLYPTLRDTLTRVNIPVDPEFPGVGTINPTSPLPIDPRPCDIKGLF